MGSGLFWIGEKEREALCVAEIGFLTVNGIIVCGGYGLVRGFEKKESRRHICNHVTSASYFNT